MSCKVVQIDDSLGVIIHLKDISKVIKVDVSESSSKLATFLSRINNGNQEKEKMKRNKEQKKKVILVSVDVITDKRGNILAIGFMIGDHSFIFKRSNGIPIPEFLLRLFSEVSVRFITNNRLLNNTIRRNFTVGITNLCTLGEEIQKDLRSAVKELSTEPEEEMKTNFRNWYGNSSSIPECFLIKIVLDLFSITAISCKAN